MFARPGEDRQRRVEELADDITRRSSHLREQIDQLRLERDPLVALMIDLQNRRAMYGTFDEPRPPD